MSQTLKKINPFVARTDGVVIPGCETGDKFYYDYKINLVYVESGNRDPETGDILATATPKVSTTKKDIEKLINSHKNEVGLKNLIAIFARTGDSSLFKQRTPLPDGDYTALTDVEKLYAELPEELKEGKTLKEFMDSYSVELFKKYLETLKPKDPVVEGGKKEGEE